MNLSVTPTEELAGVVKAPPSKSYTIRAITAAMLSEGVSMLRDPLFSADTEACITVSEKLGAGIEKTGSNLKISGTVGIPKTPDSVLDALNSGTTIRLMTAVASLCDGKVTLTGDDSIKKRPIEPLLIALRQVGVKATSSRGYPPVTVQGPLHGGVCKIRGDISSQFISSLLMALPCARKNSVVNVIGRLRSKPYVDLTLNVLQKFKIRIKSDGYFSFTIPGDQTYRAADYTVEGDYSSAAFLLAAAALTESKVTVENLFKNSLQADRRFITILREMGADVNVNGNSVTVNGTGDLNGIDVDLNHSPDLLPVTAVLGALAKGKTTIHNVAHARLKECDRIKAMHTELKKMNAQITEREDGLEIAGGKLKGTLLDGWKDHRIVMALAIAGLRAEGKTEITDGECINVTFPRFVEVMKQLGANME